MKYLKISALLVLCLFVVALASSEMLTSDNTAETAFTADRDHAISLVDASALTRNFRLNAGEDTVIGGFFGKDAVSAILNQEGAVGLRYYYGLDKDGSPHIVLVGVNSDGDDITHGLLAERSGTCPPFCASPSELNSDLEIEISSNF